jgi:hypothetical protein
MYDNRYTMSTEWYYGRNGERGGPVELSQLQAMAQRGELKPDDLVWRAGMADWLPASTVTEVAGAFQQVRPQPVQPQQPQQPWQAPQPQQPQQQYPTGQPYNPYSPHGGPMQQQMMASNGAATASMVLGIVSLVGCICGLPLGIAAIVVGMAARKNPVNQGQATAGIVMGIISTAISGLYWLIAMIGAAVSH